MAEKTKNEPSRMETLMVVLTAQTTRNVPTVGPCPPTRGATISLRAEWLLTIGAGSLDIAAYPLWTTKSVRRGASSTGAPRTRGVGQPTGEMSLVPRPGGG